MKKKTTPRIIKELFLFSIVKLGEVHKLVVNMIVPFFLFVHLVSPEVGFSSVYNLLLISTITMTGWVFKGWASRRLKEYEGEDS